MKDNMRWIAHIRGWFSARKARETGTPGSRWRSWSSPALVLAGAFFNALVYNVPLYQFASGHLDVTSFNGVITLLTLFVIVFAMTALIAGLAAAISARLVKPLFMLMAMLNAAAVYFMVTYNVVLDRTMMGNIFNTNPAEAGGLFHPVLLLYVLLLGGLPCWLLSQVHVRPTAFWRRLLFPVLVLFGMAGWMYATSQTWLWVDKYAKQLGGMVLPWSYVVNTSRYFAEQAVPHERKHLPAAQFTSDKKTVVFLLIGESARAQNSPYYGYSRNTNPDTEKAGITVFNKTHSCATYTTASLECILSHEDPGSRPAWEPLTSYLQRSGVDVTWRTNNSGEPPMQVARFERLNELKAGCSGEECAFDGGMLHGLAERITSSTQQRQLVVLHLGGSHGPAYNTRYPASFAQFTPVCQSVQLHQCSSEELVNAYDNSLRYTDHVIASAIALLKNLKDHDASLIYVSDHGESLGEFNLYLHGTPWSLAPDFQKEVPFFIWDAHARHKNNTAPVIVNGSFSQANIFHSVMGAFGMRSDIYRPELDLIGKVRGQ